MSRTFAYARVSTTDQTAANQLHEIEAAGFSVDKHRIITESISGSVNAEQRPEFADLLRRLEEGDVLIVTKLDRSTETQWMSVQLSRPWRIEASGFIALHSAALT